MRLLLRRSAAMLTICATLWAAPSLSADLAHVLDGKRFVGFNAEKGRPLDPNEREEFVFEDGRFRSVSCEPYNFESGVYSAQIVGNTIHFEAVTRSPSHGEIAWRGVIDGDEARATFVWTKERWYWNTRRGILVPGKIEGITGTALHRM